MVERLTMLAVLLLAASLHAADEPPRAAEILPDVSSLPGGNYRLPWNMGPMGKFKTEAEWREQNPAPHVAAPRLAQMVLQMTDEQWAQTVKSMKEMAESGMLTVGSGGGAQGSMLEAILEHGTREAVAKAIEDTYKGVLDSTVMTYIKVEKPEALSSPEPGEDFDPGSVANLKVELQLWEVEVLTNKLDRFEVSADQLTVMVKTLRNIYNKLLRVTAANLAEDLEEDLVTANATDPPDAEQVSETLQKMIAYAGTKVIVKGTRPGAGNTSHLVYAWRGPLADDPQISQGYAGMRRGSAVWRVSFDSAGKFCDEYEEEVTRILQQMSEASAQFTLSD